MNEIELHGLMIITIQKYSLTNLFTFRRVVARGLAAEKSFGCYDENINICVVMDTVVFSDEDFLSLWC